MNKAEMLSPAGDAECFDSALSFGADAVYLAGKQFGMRSAPANFDTQALREAVSKAHKRGVRVYLTCNTLPRNGEIDRMPAFLEETADCGVDAFIIADLGVMSLAAKYAPQVERHISTQAGVVNYQTARMLFDMGAKRVVLARELTLDDIAGIRAKTDPALEIEAFVHGSMCVSFSGRCLISSYLTGRDANRGDCAQPCRWKYHLYEEHREGEYFPVIEEDGGTYLYNSRDLCMIEHLDDVIKAGVTSLKIEGRAKAAYYVAVTTNAYRHALDSLYAAGYNGTLPAWIREELEKVSHREYSTGFFYGNEPGQNTRDGGYIRRYQVAAVCEDYKDGRAFLTQRNKFYATDELDILPPGGMPFTLRADAMLDENGEPIESAPHAMQRLILVTGTEIPPGSFVRVKR